ncbi:hypothetical protein D3C78_1447250 [compost metagenome]
MLRFWAVVLEMPWVWRETSSMRPTAVLLWSITSLAKRAWCVALSLESLMFFSERADSTAMCTVSAWTLLMISRCLARKRLQVPASTRISS